MILLLDHVTRSLLFLTIQSTSIPIILCHGPFGLARKPSSPWRLPAPQSRGHRSSPLDIITQPSSPEHPQLSTITYVSSSENHHLGIITNASSPGHHNLCTTQTSFWTKLIMDFRICVRIPKPTIMCKSIKNNAEISFLSCCVPGNIFKLFYRILNN